MVKAIIFDFFGVICPDLHEVWTTKHHLPASIYDEIGRDVDLGRAPEEAYLEMLSRKSGLPTTQIRDELDREVVINHALMELIKKLKKDYKIGLLSDASASVLNTIIDEQDLRKYFDVIGVSSMIRSTKPHPASYKFVLERLMVVPPEAVFIDDNPANVSGAKKIGMKGILFTGMESLKRELEQLGI